MMINDTAASDGYSNMQNHEYTSFVNQIMLQIYGKVKESDSESVSLSKFKRVLKEVGILDDDPRLQLLLERMDDLDNSESFSQDQFMEIISDHVSLLEKFLLSDLAVPDFLQFSSKLKTVFEDSKCVNAVSQ